MPSAENICSSKYNKLVRKFFLSNEASDLQWFNHLGMLLASSAANRRLRLSTSMHLWHLWLTVRR